MAKQAELTGMEGNRKLQDLHDAEEPQAAPRGHVRRRNRSRPHGGREPSKQDRRSGSSEQGPEQ